MREPYDYDPDKEEQRQVRRQQQAESVTCRCGNVKTPGEMTCHQCEAAFWEEFTRLNPPGSIEDNYH